jgi:hypothetical protein
VWKHLNSSGFRRSNLKVIRVYRPMMIPPPRPIARISWSMSPVNTGKRGTRQFAFSWCFKSLIGIFDTETDHLWGYVSTGRQADIPWWWSALFKSSRNRTSLVRQRIRTVGRASKIRIVFANSE